MKTNFHIQSSKLAGIASIPASKSHTLRAILFASMANGQSTIRNYLASTDAQSMIDACRLFGAQIAIHQERLEINGVNGKIKHVEDVINAGNSGIVFRFITCIAALSSQYAVITGDESIRHRRPIKPLLNSLSELGALATSTRGDGFAPIIIKGPLKTGSTTICGEDSQPVSALLIATAFLDGITEINVTNPGEIPWISLTLDWLKRLGIPFENDNFMRYRVFGPCSYPGFEYTIPGDLSTAAFPIAAAVVTNSELTINNVDMNDIQGDKAFIHLLQQMGAFIEIHDTSKTIIVKPSGQLKGVEVDINPFIDALPILSVIACFAEGPTTIKNAAIARSKECDRLHSVKNELTKMGAQIVELPDGLVIHPSQLKGTSVFSHHDHRMALSLMVAGLAAEGKTIIEETDCVSKTFPNVAQVFQSIGAKLEVVE